MKEQLYRMIFRSPQARERWEALRREGAPRWRALAALPLGAREEGRPLPAQESESARSHREPPRALARRLAPFDVVSFDVFDTLLLRDVDRPEEVFSFVGPSWAIRTSAACGWRRSAGHGRRRAGSQAPGR